MKKYRRLTTDEPQGMYEGLHNGTKVINGEVYLRDYEGHGDMNLMKYIRCKYEEVYNEQLGLDNVPAEEFGEYMDTGDIVSDFYHMCVGYAELRERLKQYEDSGLSPDEVMALAKPKEDNLNE